MSDSNNSSSPLSQKRRWIIAAAGGSIVLAAVACWIYVHKPQEAPTGPIFMKQGELTFHRAGNDTPVVLDIEIADTPERQEIGLMDRSSMEERQGMLFIFKQSHVASFWMKNTILPLDMLFIDADRVIRTIHKNTTPFSEQTYEASVPVLYVLEVNAGYTDAHAIQVGDTVRWVKQ